MGFPCKKTKESRSSGAIRTIGGARNIMFHEDQDRPHHFQEVLQAAGPPPVGVVQPPLGIDHCHTIIPTPIMNYFVSYKQAPPCIPCWNSVAPLNPNYSPQPQQPYYNVLGPWQSSPYVPSFNYCSFPPPFIPSQQSFSAWLPRTVQVQFNHPIQPPVKCFEGALNQIKNPAPKAQSVPRQTSPIIYKETRVIKTLPPDIHDETIFPSLIKKVEYLETAVNVPRIDVFSNRHVYQRSGNGLKIINSTQNSTANGTDYNKISNHAGQKIVISGEEEVTEKLLEMSIERKQKPGEMVETKHSADEQNTNQAKGYKEESQCMIPRLQRGVSMRPLTIPIPIKLQDPELYDYILMYVPAKKSLKELGYPLVSLKNPNETVILKKDFQNTTCRNNNSYEMIKHPYKLCDRCGGRFILKTGKRYPQDKCFYHWGKTQVTGDFKVFMTCCKRAPKTSGCITAKSHVWSGLNFGLNAGLKGFIRTADPIRKVMPRIFGLDCEMCFTTAGLELVKVALVDLAGRQVYYSLVIPEHEVVDYNTRFSGVSKRDYFRLPAKHFRQVQEEVLQFINKDTIIIGHGLENDLRALKIIHMLVVDTSIVYPHEHGLPFRRPLKSLANEVLKAKIQDGGHNPVEDANVCVDLILSQLEKDCKLRIIREDSNLK